MNNTSLIQRSSFHNAGLSLSYIDNHVASAEVPIVLLHGFTASAKINWLDTGWIEALSNAGRRVIALDARGHGVSDKPYDSSYYPAHVMMEDSIALLNELGVSQADYVGFSMGGRMSTFVAIRYPERVRKLIIGGLGINLKNGIGKAAPIAAALRADSPNEIKERGARRFRRIAEKYDNDLEALACCITSSREPINDDMLSAITAETLILVGEQDTTGGNPHELQPSITRSKAVSVPECNHFNALTHDVFKTYAMEFLLDS